jgi:hypothetical protein
VQVKKNMVRLVRLIFRFTALSIIANILLYIWWISFDFFPSKANKASDKHCLMNSFVHGNKETMLYVKNSIQSLGKKYANCSAGNLSSAEAIKIKYPQYMNESYVILLDSGYIIKIFMLDPGEKDSSVKCILDLFDKKMNAGDHLQNLVYKDTSVTEIRLDERKVTEIVVNSSGFYSIQCWLQSAELKQISVFKEVFLILPHNMQRLIYANRPSRQVTEQLRREKLKKPSTNKELLAYADCDECDIVDGGELSDKMSVLVIVLDSVSYPFLKRSFPLTYKYLIDELENNLMFENLNIVGENTYPNMLALLTGVLKETNDELGRDSVFQRSPERIGLPRFVSFYLE